jgi:hypothetical protein
MDTFSLCNHAVLDASFMEKSGEKMGGLGKFYNSKQGKAEKGLEISTLAVIDADYTMPVLNHFNNASSQSILNCRVQFF